MNQRETMTSRERVVRAMNHRPVDRAPIDLGVHYSTGISAFAYWNLREYLGLNTSNIQIPDMAQFLAYVDEDILRRFHCDCMLLFPGWQDTHRWNPRGQYEFTIPSTAQPHLADGEWRIERDGAMMRMPKGGFFFDGSWLSLESRSEPELVAALTRESRRINEETDYATMYIGFGAYFGGIDWLCDALLDPDAILEANRQQCDRDIEWAGKLIDNMGGYIQAVCLAADMGMQSGPFCSPDMLERITGPSLRRFCKFMHDNSDIKVFLHNCGSIRPLIPVLIDCGVDILNPVQISAENMNPADLVKDFGDKIVFWGGGCNTQTTLGTGTPDEVAANVRQLMSEFKKAPGFVFNQVHNIMGNVPPENIVAMLDTAYEESFF